MDALFNNLDAFYNESKQTIEPNLIYSAFFVHLALAALIILLKSLEFPVKIAFEILMSLFKIALQISKTPFQVLELPVKITFKILVFLLKIALQILEFPAKIALKISKDLLPPASMCLLAIFAYKNPETMMEFLKYRFDEESKFF